ncbi:MAG: cofactor-independent phosphoglycerate mutase [Candidatus Sumerlaeia bacterium]|nr:cofactor-independent phosphoglycerate mutase [Candidatus Sumerlaeia bacterium]
MKYVIFLGDGMADLPHEKLGGKTALQVARKPNLDTIARKGRCGLFRTLFEDMEAGSDTAHLSVLGYDPHKVSQGRAVLEAASMGVDIPAGSIGMRCNLITTENGRIINHSAGHITSEESAELLSAIQAEVDPAVIRFHTGVSYRHLFVARGLNHHLECSPPHNHPGEEVEKHMIRPANGDARETAQMLNDLTRRSWEIFADHPVNKKRRDEGKDPATSIWLWSPGIRPEMWTYPDRFGIKGSVISAVDLIHGIGVYAGLDKVVVEGATGLWDTNFEGKADACLKVLEDQDFCFLHVEGPDEAGHEGDLDLKIHCIEDFDRRCVGRVMEGLEKRGIKAVMATLPDHATPAALRIHTRDPIPFAIWHPDVPGDDVEMYDEDSCAAGSFGTIEGDTFIRTFFGK